MKNSIIISIITTAALLFNSCTSDKDIKNGRRPNACSLNSNEVLIVANKSWLSHGDGIEFRNIVERPIKGLPQPEPNFHVTSINPRDYKGKFTIYANILVADINKDYDEAKLDIRYDVNAKSQVIIVAAAPSSSKLMSLLENKKDSILNIFVKNEIDSERRILKKTHSNKVLESSQKMFGISMYAPVDIETVTTHDNFYWATSKNLNNEMNICMYSIPCTSKKDLNLTSFIEKRDSVMKKYVQGEKDNQFMKTDTRELYERTRVRDNRLVYEVRGLWYMENDAMGGPFVSYSYFDSKNKRLIVVEGFVFAPHKKKHTLIRKLEAAIQEVKS